VSDRSATAALVHTALDAAKAEDDRSLLTDITLQDTWVFRRPDRFVERAEFIAQLVALPDDRLTAEQRSAVQNEAAWLALESGDRTAFERHAAAVNAIEGSLKRGVSRRRDAELSHARGYLDGDVRTVERAADERRAVDEATGEPGAAPIHALADAMPSLLRGDWTIAGSTLLESGIGDGPLRPLMIWGNWFAGEERAARRQLLALADTDFAEIRGSTSWLGLGLMTAWVAALAEQPLTTRALYESLRSFRGRVALLPGNIPLIPVDAVLGLAAASIRNIDDATALFDDALGLADRLVSPSLRLLTLPMLGWHLSRLDRPDAEDRMKALLSEVDDVERATRLGLASAQRFPE
jgi:hypothetical protein